ncbi:hypothetical protein [Streptomyces sp. A30]|uniref:hypothetical protein n=1 Tax=Streptomyces sp. A30 TaxID=2789273 RepID=UPI003981174C
MQDVRRRGEVCRPLDWIPEVHHPIGNSEAVILEALVLYRRGSDADGAMLADPDSCKFCACEWRQAPASCAWDDTSSLRRGLEHAPD